MIIMNKRDREDIKYRSRNRKQTNTSVSASQGDASTQTHSIAQRNHSKRTVLTQPQVLQPVKHLTTRQNL